MTLNDNVLRFSIIISIIQLINNLIKVEQFSVNVRQLTTFFLLIIHSGQNGKINGFLNDYKIHIVLISILHKRSNPVTGRDPDLNC